MEKLINKEISDKVKEYFKKYRKEIMIGALVLSGLLLCILTAILIVKIAAKKNVEEADGYEEELEDDFFEEEA